MNTTSHLQQKSEQRFSLITEMFLIGNYCRALGISLPARPPRHRHNPLNYLRNFRGTLFAAGWP